MNEKICTDKAPKAIGPYSQAVKAGNTLYISGVMPIDPKTGLLVESEIKAQASQIMKNIDELLKAAGYSAEDVVKTTCFLADISYFADFNSIYGDYFTSNPARSCVAVKSLPKDALVEVEVIAYR